jgi:MerR family transcriptional regulator, light-induced transcriptional regulator
MDYAIKTVAKMTGLTPHVIRAWERRYAAVQPTRTEGRHRLYSDADVERLQLLRRLTEAGHAIGHIARRSSKELQSLAGGNQSELLRPNTDLGRRPVEGEILIKAGLEAVRSLNTAGLEEVLDRAIVTLGHQGLLRHVVAPLVQAVGELWKEGAITAAHEHFASALIRGFLTSSARPFAKGSGPKLLVATPAGQLHELGAVLVAAAAINDGWEVVYLGTSLPAAEIAGAALQNQVRALALSLVYPEDDPNMATELEKLRKYLPAQIRILAGGRAAPAYRAALEKIAAVHCGSLSDLYRHLEILRHSEAGRGRAHH